MRADPAFNGLGSAAGTICDRPRCAAAGHLVGALLLSQASGDGKESGLGLIIVVERPVPESGGWGGPHAAWRDVDLDGQRHSLRQAFASDVRLHFVHSGFMVSEDPDHVLLTAPDSLGLLRQCPTIVRRVCTFTRKERRPLWKTVS